MMLTPPRLSNTHAGPFTYAGFPSAGPYQDSNLPMLTTGCRLMPVSVHSCWKWSCGLLVLGSRVKMDTAELLEGDACSTPLERDKGKYVVIPTKHSENLEPVYASNWELLKHDTSVSPCLNKLSLRSRTCFSGDLVALPELTLTTA